MIVGILCDWAGVVQGNPMSVGIYLRKSFGRSIIPATIGIDRTGVPTDLDNLTRGGFGAIAFAIAVGPGPRTAEGVKAARAEAEASPFEPARRYH